MLRKPRRWFHMLAIATAVILAGWQAAAAAESPAADRVPMLHVSDLFRPHNDPDDHWDLACAYALTQQGRADLLGVLIDFPQGGRHNDPDVLAVAQLNYLTGLAVPAMVGSPRVVSPEEAKSDASRTDLGGVRAFLDILRRAPKPVVISILGSTRDVAIAGRLEPDLFARQCAAIYLNAGSGSPDPAKTARLEWNVGLDSASYAAIFQLPCPVYWMPCFEDAGEFRVAEYGTFFRFRQDEILPHLADPVQNFFAYMYKHGRRAADAQAAAGLRPDWLRYLLGPKEAELLAGQGAQFRNMWCTAGFLHAAGLTVARDGRILARGEAPDAVFSFDPIRITCTPDGRTQWTSDPAAKDRFIFHVRDVEHYQSAMTAALKSLLLPLH